MASTTAEILEGIPHQMKPSGGIANVCKVCNVIIPRSPYKCQVCGIYIHKKCLESLQPRCIAVAPKDLQDKQVKAGYLQKAGESSGVMARMQKRYIVLTTDGFLYYFTDQNSPTPKGVIDLVNFNSTQAERSKGFKVSNPRDSESRAYVFQADSAKDQESWIQAITASTRQAQDNRDRILQDMRNSAIKTSSSERRMHRNLFVKVAEARNLPAMDITGTSDPYCLIRASQTLIRTSTIWNNNKNPLWGEQYDIVINDADAEGDLAVTIYDEDFMSADDLIGQVKVPIASLKGQDFVEKWFKVAPLSHSDITGDLRIQTSFNVSEKTLKVKVVEARNLKAADMNGFSDPYVKVNLGKSTKKTKTIKKNLNPFFNEEFTLKYTDYNTDNLKLTVWDWDLVGSDDFLGQVLISISSLATGVVDEWYPLKGNTGSSSSSSSASSSSSSSSGSSSSASSTPRDSEPDLGEIRLKLKYTEDLILPSDHYYPLAGLMYQYIEMSLLLGDVCKEKADVSKSLVSIYEVSNQSLRFVDALTSHEINNTPNPDIIFRGNSAVTKGVDFYMKMVGRVYLQKVLGTFITEQYDQKRCFEVDPAKADKGMDVKKNAKQIELLAESLITRIFNSVEDCPSVMRAVFKNIQATVAAKYPAESIKIVKYTAVTGFLFLRFFVPAILSPKLFNLMDSHPSPQTSRNLTIIGKVVQNLANLVPFGDKEPYMAELNPFILRNLDRLKGFVDSICNIAPERVVESSISSQNVEYDKEMAYCLRYFSTHFDKMVEKDPSAPYLDPLDSVIKSLVAITNQPL